MTILRPFRFGVMASNATSHAAWVAQARKAEVLGYSTLGIGEHLAWGGLAPLVALMAAADATTTLRLATHVLINDYRHPALLANEIATLDRLSGGRVEFGLGAGWLAQDYTVIGMPFDAPASRVRRLEEAVRLIKQFFSDEPVTFSGTYYQAHELNLGPKPLQRPHPPVFIGGGGKSVLSLAAREATIIGLHSKAAAAGGPDMATRTAAAFDQQVRWIHDAAGDRCSDLEFNIHIVQVKVTENRRQGAEEVLRWFADFPPGLVVNPPQTIEEILEAPWCLLGTVEEIVADLQERRSRYGVSYINVNGEFIDTFSPIVEQLAGT